MTEASKLNIKVSAGGEQSLLKKKSLVVRKTRTPMLEEVIAWINSLNLSPEIKEQLIKKAKKYPLDAMNRFREKLTHHIREIQKNISAGNYTKEELNENE